jgi:hypothetical protein
MNRDIPTKQLILLLDDANEKRIIIKDLVSILSINPGGEILTSFPHPLISFSLT